MTILSYADAIARKAEWADTSTYPQALIQGYLDSAEEEILAILGGFVTDSSGEPEAIEELITTRGNGDILMLSRRASYIVSIVEGDTTLTSDDYQVMSSGQTLRRLDDGSNPASAWNGRVRVKYEPLSDAGIRERVQLALVELEVNSSPGSRSERIGEWSETVSQSSTSYQDERQAILASLIPSRVAIF